MPVEKTDRKMLVITELEVHGNKTRAARRARVTRQTINRWCQSSPAFKAACAAAVKAAKE